MIIETAFKWSMDTWLEFLRPITNEVWIFGMMGVFAFIALFFILRKEMKDYGEAWAFGGGELVVAGGIGVLATGAIFAVPFIIWAVIGMLIVSLFMLAMKYLVALTVRN